MGSVMPSTVHVPSVPHPKSKPAMLTPAYVVLPLVLAAMAVAEAEETAEDAVADEKIGTADEVARESTPVDASGATVLELRAERVAVAAVKAELILDFRRQGIWRERMFGVELT